MLSPFVLLILFSLSVDSLLINVKKSCVPLQIAKGPCHKCVCNIEGIFKCQSTECQNQTLENSGKLNNKGECQPLMTYQYEDLYCTCNYEGKWMSYNCRAYFQNIRLDDNNIHNKNLRINLVSDNQLPKGDIEPIKEGDSCVPGKLYKVSCNTCQCAPNNALICTKMLCLDSTIRQKIESLKNTRNKTIEFNRRNVPDGTYNKLKSLTEIVPPKECVPGKLYRNGCHKCLCRHNQVFTCTKKCHSSLQNRISDYEISQLETRSILDIPRLPHVGTECEPGRTYTVSCNLCYCSDMRDLVCTLKYCLNISSYAVIQANKLTGTPCTKDYIKQCAKCQCVDGKSVCTGLKTCFSDIGGKQLLSSAGNKVKLSLDATKDKCVPHASYKVHCNDCFCQPDGSLRCTQKTCLTHSQAKELNERQTYLKMLQESISLALLTHLVYEINSLRACVPNTYFILNDSLCYCNYKGAWSETNCTNITRNQLCQSGQVIWEGCKRCVCQENKRLICTNVFCQNNSTNFTIYPQTALSGYSPNCLPFQSYYVNCSLCLCPASGRSFDAQCVFDASCSLHSYIISEIPTILKRNQCIPNVMYLYPCIQCFCSEYGLFDLDKCVPRCGHTKQLVQKCKPGTLYRHNCEVCRCSDNGTRERNLCIKSDCIKHSQDKYALRSSSVRCTPRTFTRPICLFCECNSEGTVNETACLELSCSTMSYLRYGKTEKCSPGELVSTCIECFCLSNGITNENYCTRSCTYASKVKILEKILSQSPVDMSIIDKTKINHIKSNDPCKPNALYISNRRYCLCSNKAKELYCTSIFEEIKIKTKQVDAINKIDINTKCEPYTLVDFDCNTCYCSKKGKIDPKWCTYDDCEAKRLVQESHKSHIVHASDEDENGGCTSGSISKVKCNYCICPESGFLQERACTKNNCFNSIDVTDHKFTCEPLAYYEVDCNICYCPRDGLKNVDKCTKNQCEKSFLRVDSCVPGHLFIDMCNVCVCPPNGDKEDKVCTNHTCGIPPWNIFKFSANLLNNDIQDDTIRSLDRCIPGEEFVMGCDLCVCSDLGLKSYSTCEPILCEDSKERQGRNENASLEYEKNSRQKNNYYSTDVPQKSKRVRRHVDTDCFTYNISQSAERHDCTPGSMYIIRCRECICPYIGNINNFCRPLPKNVYCEQPYPGFNFLPMGRRHVNDSRLSTKSNATITASVRHIKHTLYQCQTPGQVRDDCFICECNNGTVILEHCYKNDSASCVDKKPSFLFNKVTTK